MKCYERRKKCYERFGWCYAADEWGFCNEINYLPDEPDDEDPLFEVPTFIWPKEVAACGLMLNPRLNLIHSLNNVYTLFCYFFYFPYNKEKLPFQHCGSGVLQSNTRICTGHISKAPSQYTFLVEKGFIDIVDRSVRKKLNIF